MSSVAYACIETTNLAQSRGVDATTNLGRVDGQCRIVQAGALCSSAADQLKAPAHRAAAVTVEAVLGIAGEARITHKL